MSGSPSLEARVHSVDWRALDQSLDEDGHAIVRSLLTEDECRDLVALFDDASFRSRVVMAKHGYGKGEYRYFAYPLPPLVAALRASLYEKLVPVASRWSVAAYPPTHEEYLARCHAAGQTRPTPLVLRYGAGDYNRLHQDLYGEHVFPIQVAILLAEPGIDFQGGEFVLTEQRPRMQSRAMVVPLRRGDAVAFAVHHRPMQGTRGTYRVTMRHGVSRLHSGHRHTLGIIFHDAT
jgi:hypothetical protein